MAYLSVENLSKTFGQTQVLGGVSFSLEKGKVLAVIGSSGNGKTTLLRILNGLESADSGSIWIDGKKIFPVFSDKKGEKVINGDEKGSAEDEKGIDGEGKGIGENGTLDFTLVFQNFQLFPQYTALRNVSLAADLYACKKLKREKLPHKERKQRKKEIVAENEKRAALLLEKVGLKDKINAYPCELSGGQQQRVAIARALMLQPKILCFDEPTSALDPHLTGEISALINELKRDGRTMIVVTHEMEFAKSVADEVLFLHEGKVLETGAADEIFSHPTSEAFCDFLAAGNSK